MQIIKMFELVYVEPKPATQEERQQRQDRILADLLTPMYLGRYTGVAYDHKSDRYAVTSEISGKKLTLKATNEVVTFIASHIDEIGYWRGRMESGTLVDVNLIQAG